MSPECALLFQKSLDVEYLGAVVISNRVVGKPTKLVERSLANSAGNKRLGLWGILGPAFAKNDDGTRFQGLFRYPIRDSWSPALGSVG